MHEKNYTQFWVASALRRCGHWRSVWEHYTVKNAALGNRGDAEKVRAHGESEERLLHKMMGVLLLPLVKTINKNHVYIWYIHLFIFSTRKINVIAASFLTLQFEYFKVDRLGCLLDLWCGRLMNISTDMIKHDFLKTQSQVHF